MQVQLIRFLYQFKRFLLGLSPFPGNIGRVEPGLSLVAVNTLHSADDLRNLSGKRRLVNKVFCGEALPRGKKS